MSRQKIIVAVAAVLLIGGAVAAISAPGERWGARHGHKMHGHMHGDLDGDVAEMGPGFRGRFGSSMSKTDYETRVREGFARLDKNSDGVIDRSEVEAMVADGAGRRGRDGLGGKMGQHATRLFDANRDGKVTREEARAEIERRFSEADLNGDGRIDDADLPPLMRGRNAISDGGMGMGMGHGRHPGGMNGMLGWLKRADENRDGVVTREEALAHADREHARFDLNKDGTVDQADRDGMAKEMRDYRVQRFLHHFGAKDGRITREQFQAKFSERFARLDLDGDGSISRSERRGGHGWHGRGGNGMGGPGHSDRGMAPREPGDNDRGPASATPPRN